jgi:hypothetical protein
VVALTSITLNPKSSLIKRLKSLKDLNKMILVVICELILTDSVTIFNTEESNTVLKLQAAVDRVIS